MGALHGPSCWRRTVAPVNLLPTAVGQAYQVGQPCRYYCPCVPFAVVQRIFSSLSTFVVYLAKGTPPSLQVLTPADTLYGYCTLTFNYIKSYYNRFLITNPIEHMKSSAPMGVVLCCQNKKQRNPTGIAGVLACV